MKPYESGPIYQLCMSMAAVSALFVTSVYWSMNPQGSKPIFYLSGSKNPLREIPNPL